MEERIFRKYTKKMKEKFQEIARRNRELIRKWIRPKTICVLFYSKEVIKELEILRKEITKERTLDGGRSCVKNIIKKKK